jgi:hypothetical protein
MRDSKAVESAHGDREEIRTIGLIKLKLRSKMMYQLTNEATKVGLELLYVWETVKHKLIYDIFDFTTVQLIDYLLCHPKHLKLVFIYLSKLFMNGSEPC